MLVRFGQEVNFKGVEHLKGNYTLYIIEKQEKEANIVLSVDKWEEIDEQQWKTTSPYLEREYGWKNVTRFFFITPAQKIYEDTRCFCGCPSNKIK